MVFHFDPYPYIENDMFVYEEILLGGIPTPLKNMSSSMGRVTSHNLGVPSDKRYRPAYIDPQSLSLLKDSSHHLGAAVWRCVDGVEAFSVQG